MERWRALSKYKKAFEEELKRGHKLKELTSNHCKPLSDYGDKMDSNQPN